MGKIRGLMEKSNVVKEIKTQAQKAARLILSGETNI
jgi:hypothetical protein